MKIFKKRKNDEAPASASEAKKRAGRPAGAKNKPREPDENSPLYSRLAELERRNAALESKISAAESPRRKRLEAQEPADESDGEPDIDPETGEPNTYVCHKCGKEFPRKVKRCDNCGEMLNFLCLGYTALLLTLPRKRSFLLPAL